MRNLETNRYWINENLIKIKVGKKMYNIAPAIRDIIDTYGKTKTAAFEKFLQSCLDLQQIATKGSGECEQFILGLLAPNIDARLFEIVSYAILKYYYHDQKIYWGFEIHNLKKENLKLYKTGRTNANDGGIDFVMKPLGRFFQVTETLDVSKYFLDIDNIPRLHEYFLEAVRVGYLKKILDEVVLQSKIEFNYSDDEDALASA